METNGIVITTKAAEDGLQPPQQKATDPIVDKQVEDETVEMFGNIKLLDGANNPSETTPVPSMPKMMTNQTQHNRDHSTPSPTNNVEAKEEAEANENEENNGGGADTNTNGEEDHVEDGGRPSSGHAEPAENEVPQQQLQTTQTQASPPPALPPPPQQQQSSSTSAAPPSKLKFEERHLLKTQWDVWYLNHQKSLDWMDRLKRICTIGSVEQFWALYDNIRTPSFLQSGCDYMFFKTHIQPVWEVDENKDGGRLVIQIEKNHGLMMDKLWLELLLALIGEQFGPDMDHICGAVCNIRQKGHKICLWTKDKNDEEVNRRIGLVMKSRFLEAIKEDDVKDMFKGQQIKIAYEEHTLVQNKLSSAIQSRFIL